MGTPGNGLSVDAATHDLFQADSNQFTMEVLQAVQVIYGPNAPEKLLYQFFRKEGAEPSKRR